MKPAALLPILIAMACGPRPAATPAPTPAPAPTSSSLPGADRDRHPCDPVVSREPAPPPRPDPNARCGNGVIDVLPGACATLCSGGCEAPIACHVECTAPREHCDGADNGFTCESQGYLGGAMRCTSECYLDDAACVACAPGPTTRCGTTALSGDDTFAVSGAKTAAVFVRDEAGGRLRGARVDAQLKTKAFAKLPAKTLAAGAIDGGLGFVDDRRRFGVIDVGTGRARMLGPIGDDSTPILIIRESLGAGGAVVLTGSGSRRTLAVFDPPRAKASGAPRHFAIDNYRVVVVPGDHELARGVTTGGAELVVLAFGTEIFAYQRDGLELRPLPAVPPGIALAFTYPMYTDTITWSTGRLAITQRTSPDDNAPPPGLSRAAISGARRASAFGGMLLVGAPQRHRPVELYWTATALLAAPPPP